ATRSALSARTRTAQLSPTAGENTTQILCTLVDCADAIWNSPPPAEAETAWRERPLLWPRARSQTRSDLVVVHATVLRSSTLADRGELVRTQRVPARAALTYV